MIKLKSSEELANVNGPAWNDIVIHIRHASNTIDVLPVDAEQGLDVLEKLQVTARSFLGALAINCGGILVDNGWLRLLGGGSEELVSLAEINNFKSREDVMTSPYIIVAYDVLGGLFAIDGGGLGFAPGEICYFAPETMEWESLGLQHSSFVIWALTGNINLFYEAIRWEGWEEETKNLKPNEAYGFFPDLSMSYTNPDGTTNNKRDRFVVPAKEVFFMRNGITLN